MNIQRFLAATSREAMAKARAAFGDSAVILSSRATPGGFEVVATTEENLSTLPVGAAGAAASAAMGGPVIRKAPLAALTAAPAPRGAPASTNGGKPDTVERDTETMAMSTLSFQDYVRERMLKRRKEAMEAQSSGPLGQRSALEGLPLRQATAVTAAPAPAARPKANHEGLGDLSRMATAGLGHQSVAPIRTRSETPRQHAAAEPWAAAINLPPVGAQAAHAADVPHPITGEIHALRELIEDRFNMLAWLGSSRNNPMQSNLMLKLIRAGYSPALVRTVLERLPSEGGPAEAVRWVLDVLARNLKTADSAASLVDEGGVISLMGATGVGKTTTAAKLAAQCVKAYGVNSVGLITLDTYRVAGYEQLRSYGRMMGVVAHLAHDRAALKDLLNLLSGKRLVVIDTAGLGQKDPRIQDMLEVLNMPTIKKVLVLNASSHGDTLDDVLSTFKAKALHGVVLSKVDEAVKLGPALDALIRHQVMLRGVANGQRVPEDWARPDAMALVRASMGTAGKSAFDPTPSELGFFFAQPAQAHMNTGALRV